MAAQVNERLFDEKLEALEKSRTWSPRLVSKLESTIRNSDDYSLFRINPLQYAVEKNVSENEAVDLFLHGTKVGLFEMDWHLVCPICAHVIESLKDLSDVHSHVVCDICQLEADLSLDDFIQVTFTISPQIRPISFHDPLSLPIEDLYYKYQFSKGVMPIHGLEYEDLVRYITKLVAYVPPQQTTTLEIEPGGMLLAKDLTASKHMIAFVPAHEQNDSSRELQLKLMDGKFHSVDRALSPLRVNYGEVQFDYPQVGQIPTEKFYLAVENQTETPRPLCVIQYPPGFTPEFPQFHPFLSGKKLVTTQTFRDLFRSETVSTTEGLGIKDITFLFTDLKGSTAMYDAIGDPKAYYLVRQHFDALSKVVAKNNGAIVKTIGDAIMATFMTPDDAVIAAVAMLKAIDEFNRSISQNLYLKVGIHRGHSIAVTLNERLDYFGQTVNIAARVQGLADADEIYVTEDIFNVLNNKEVLADCVVTPEQVAVKGVSDQLKVHKITLR